MKLYSFDKVGLTDVFPSYTSSAAWADYDGDGDQDVIAVGSENGIYMTRIYRRNNETLVVAKELPGFVNGTAIWFDFDNDGDPDILVNGGTNTTDPWNNNEGQAKIFINTGSDFVEYAQGMPLKGGYSGVVKTADLDNDGKDEIILSGNDAVCIRWTDLFIS